MNQALQELGEYVEGSIPGSVTRIIQDHDELILFSTSQGIIPLLTFLRDDANCFFKILSDICGVDYPDREKGLKLSITC